MTIQHRLAPGKYRLTVEDFLRLDEAGAFGTDRTELLRGDIIVMNAEYRPHGWMAGELGYRLRRALEDSHSALHVMTASVALSEHDMPLPDLTLTSEPRGAGPIPRASVALVVEVASTTTDRDLGDKVSLYASAGVPEYWIADIDARTIHQLWAPAGDAFARSRRIAVGETIHAATIAGLSVDTAGL